MVVLHVIGPTMTVDTLSGKKDVQRLGAGKLVRANVVVNLIQEGKTVFKIVLLSEFQFRAGNQVSLYTRNGVDFIRADPNETPSDNLESPSDDDN